MSSPLWGEGPNLFPSPSPQGARERASQTSSGFTRDRSGRANSSHVLRRGRPRRAGRRRGRGHDPPRPAEDRHRRLGDRGDEGTRPRQDCGPRHRDDRTRHRQLRQDCASRRGGGPDRLGLAVGRARAGARRQAPVHALFDRARRSDGAEGFPGPRARRSRRPLARRRRRAARQELVDGAGRWAEGGPGSRQVRPRGLWRAAADRREARERRTRRRARILDLQRRSRGARLPPGDRHGRCREDARRNRPGGDDRLRLHRGLRQGPRRRAQAVSRRRGQGARGAGERSFALGAHQGAAASRRRRHARNLSQALRRGRAEPTGGGGGGGRARALSRDRRGRRGGPRRRRAGARCGLFFDPNAAR